MSRWRARAACRIPWLVAVLVLSYFAVSSAPPRDEAPDSPVAGAGQTRTVTGWRLRSSGQAGQDGVALSSPSYDDGAWTSVPARSTVLGGLVAAGKYPDLNYSANLRDKVDPQDFTVPWWYRTTVAATPKPGTHTFVDLPGGVIPQAEVWFNGTMIAGPDVVAGAYPAHRFDVSGLLRPGVNALAIKVFPSSLCLDPETDPCPDLSIGFLDWSRPPPDNSMGVWRDVRFAEAGAVSLRDPRVVTRLAVPGLESAELTVKAELTNNTDRTVVAKAGGKIDSFSFGKNVTLAPHENATVTFEPIHLDRPRVWWPAQMGGQPMYRLAMAVSADDTPSDRATTAFGVRDVQSRLNDAGDRYYVVNGKPFLVRGAGWAPDLFLRYDARRLEDEFSYVRDLGLNTIRLEGKGENDEFYQLADRLGIMLLPGWECCTKWQAYAKWSPADHAVAKASAVTEGHRLRNHPSILGFYVGSDTAPTPEVEKEYLDGLAASDWQAPVISSIGWRTSPQLGKSGNKGLGPYWWVPPSYWYGKQKGGAFGFEAEHGPGPAIPDLRSLEKILSPRELADLWQHGDKPQFHLSWSSNFDRLAEYSTALERRYGKPADLADFVEKSQLANYEVNRAQFEAYGAEQSTTDRPATGTIYWLVNNAWPSLFWHLYDYSMAPSGGYFGARTALRPLHVQYRYDNAAVALVNTGLRDAGPLSVQATVFDLDGTQRYDHTTNSVTAKGNATSTLDTVPVPEGISTTYFVRLLLRDAQGNVVDRNVYWLSTKPDEVDYQADEWRLSPQTAFADLSGLRRLAAGTVSVNAASEGHGDDATTSVTLTNTGDKVAFFLRATVTADGAEVAPAIWSDDYVTLWPGESVTLTAKYRRAQLHGAEPVVQLKGVNVEARELAAAFH
ncbi:exo-beta-D-glucosaminidase [Amycolatopsis sp. NPDC059021]|uniref:glycoside hydrolase family 2 protein n=1 Tax=Amycolatopsis sp. NPDC059021 TaxID=3346704 RepID=UPI00366D74A8